MKSFSAEAIVAALLVAFVNASSAIDANWDNRNLYQWVVPGAVVGLSVMIGVFCIFGGAMYNLMAIQSPIAFETKTPAWGKVEETE